MTGGEGAGGRRGGGASRARHPGSSNSVEPARMAGSMGEEGGRGGMGEGGRTKKWPDSIAFTPLGMTSQPALRISSGSLFCSSASALGVTCCLRCSSCSSVRYPPGSTYADGCREPGPPLEGCFVLRGRCPRVPAPPEGAAAPVSSESDLCSSVSDERGLSRARFSRGSGSSLRRFGGARCLLVFE